MTIECLVLGMYIISIIFFRFISLSKICLARSVAGQDLCWGDNQWQNSYVRLWHAHGPSRPQTISRFLSHS